MILKKRTLLVKGPYGNETIELSDGDVITCLSYSPLTVGVSVTRANGSVWYRAVFANVDSYTVTESEAEFVEKK